MLSPRRLLSFLLSRSFSVLSEPRVVSALNSNGLQSLPSNAWNPFLHFCSHQVRRFHVWTAHLFTFRFEKEKLILIRFTFIGLLKNFFFFHFISLNIHWMRLQHLSAGECEQLHSFAHLVRQRFAVWFRCRTFRFFQKPLRELVSLNRRVRLRFAGQHCVVRTSALAATKHFSFTYSDYCNGYNQNYSDSI